MHSTISKTYVAVKFTAEVPKDDRKYLWFDSTGIIKEEAYASYSQVQKTLGFLFDSWLKEVYR